MTDLRNLPKMLDEKKVLDIATTIRKYQDYKLGIIVDKLDSDLSTATKKNYVSGGVSYIKTGKKYNSVPSSLYKALDKVIAECVQPLRPSKDEKKRAYKKDYCKKDNIPPITKLEIIKKKLTAKVNYGIKIEDSIRCFPSYDEASGFLKGLKFMGNNKGTMVSFEGLEEVK